MMTNNPDNNVFIIISLFLIAIVALMSIIQFIAWLIAHFYFKKTKTNLTAKTYTLLLENQEDKNIKIKKVRWTIKFANYQSKNRCLKLKINNFQEKTIWNCYHNLISILLIKWKKEKKNTNITLIASTLVFYFSIIMTITCTLIYYINLSQKTINKIDMTILNIFSFVTLLILVLSWLIWTMSYEKLRKEIIELATKLNDETLLKSIKIISGYKTLFPGSELLI